MSFFCECIDRPGKARLFLLRAGVTDGGVVKSGIFYDDGFTDAVALGSPYAL